MAGIITAIKPQVKHKERLSIFIDDKFAFGISELLGFWLKVGQLLDDKKIEYLLVEESFNQAYTKAGEILSRKRNTTKELREKLTKAGFEPEIVERVIGRMTANNYLNDFDYAVAWIHYRNSNNPRGSRVLQLELKQRGIAPEIIIKALTETTAEDQQFKNDVILTTAQKCYAKFVVNPKLDQWQLKRKFIDFLLRRGFGYAEINRTWKTITQEKVDLENLTTEDDF